MPPARVFFAFADKATKRRWLIEGEGWEIYEFSADFRVGGGDMSRFSYKGSPEIRNDTQSSGHHCRSAHRVFIPDDAG